MQLTIIYYLLLHLECLLPLWSKDVSEMALKSRGTCYLWAAAIAVTMQWNWPSCCTFRLTSSIDRNSSGITAERPTLSIL